MHVDVNSIKDSLEGPQAFHSGGGDNPDAVALLAWAAKRVGGESARASKTMGGVGQVTGG